MGPLFAAVLTPILLGWAVQVSVDGPVPRTLFVLSLLFALAGGISLVREELWVRYPPAPPPMR